jgi:hypothetical protein
VRPPPAPQQKLRSWLRGASTSLAGEGGDGARLLVDVAIAAQVAGSWKTIFSFPGPDGGTSGAKAPRRVFGDCALSGQTRGVDPLKGTTARGSDRRSGRGTRCGARLGRRAVFLPVFLDGADAVGADGDDLFDFVCSRASRLASASCWKSRSLPRRRTGSPVHFSLRRTP